MKSLLDFWDKKPTSADIDWYYDQTRKLIENRFDQSLNPNYRIDFLFMSQPEIDELRLKQLSELSTETAFVLLAYIESMFRTDFVRRLENRKLNDNLTKYFRLNYNPSQRIYQFKLEDIFEGWKRHYGGVTDKMINILNTLPQYYDYRNWVAHGRYWRFKETNYDRKYNYISIQMLLSKINQEFGGKLKT